MLSSIRKNLTSVFSNVIWLCLIGYFVFHVISGARGVISWIKLSKQVESLEKKAQGLKEENAFLENKIRFFRNDNLDLDLLEEQSRNILGFANEDDIIVLLKK